MAEMGLAGEGCRCKQLGALQLGAPGHECPLGKSCTCSCELSACNFDLDIGTLVWACAQGGVQERRLDL
jgi:hypothetical protein